MHPSESKTQKAAVLRGIGWAATQSWGNEALSLLVFLMLARLLAPSAFGLVAMANVGIQLTKVFVDQGLLTALVQRKELMPRHLNSAFWASVIGSVIFCIIIGTSASLIARLYGEPGLENIVLWMSLVFLPTGLTAVQEALLTREMRFRALAIRTIGATAAGGIVGVAMALNGSGALALVGQHLTTATMGVLLLWRSSTWRPQFAFSLHAYRELLGFSVRVLGIRLLYFTSRRSDDFLVGYFLGATALGYYAVAYRIFKSLLEMFSRIIARVALPILSTLQDDPPKLRAAFYRFTKMTAIVAFPVFVSLGLFANDVVEVVFGVEWLPSAVVMQWLVVAGMIQALVIIAHQAMLGAGHAGWTLRFLAISTSTSLVAFSIAVTNGIAAVAAAFAIAELCLVPVYVVILNRLLGVRPMDLLRSLRVPVVASAALILVGVVALFSGGESLPPLHMIAFGALPALTAYAATVLAADSGLRRRAVELAFARRDQTQ